jgi:hypothetical protein
MQMRDQIRLKHYSIRPAQVYGEGPLLADSCLLRLSAMGRLRPVATGRKRLNLFF